MKLIVNEERDLLTNRKSKVEEFRKYFGKLLNNVPNVIGEYQCDFKKGISTMDHIFTLRQILSKYYGYNKNIHLVFVDFKQVYNIIRKKL